MPQQTAYAYVPAKNIAIFALGAIVGFILLTQIQSSSELGIAGIVISLLFGVGSIMAFILNLIVRIRDIKHQRQLKSSGDAITSMVLAGIGMMVFLLAIILFPFFTRVRSARSTEHLSKVRQMVPAEYKKR